MKLLLRGGRVVDPTTGEDAIRDLLGAPTLVAMLFGRSPSSRANLITTFPW